MFFIVKYGDGQTEIFNPNCKNSILLDNIKERCSCDTRDTVDLSDEQGVVKNLHKNLLDYGTEYVHHRENLILLKVHRIPDAEEEGVHYVPLLSGKEDDREFIARLNPKPITIRSHRHPDDKSNRTARRGSVITSSGRRSSITGGRRGSRVLTTGGGLLPKK